MSTETQIPELMLQPGLGKPCHIPGRFRHSQPYQGMFDHKRASTGHFYSEIISGFKRLVVLKRCMAANAIFQLPFDNIGCWKNPLVMS